MRSPVEIGIIVDTQILIAPEAIQMQFGGTAPRDTIIVEDKGIGLHSDLAIMLYVHVEDSTDATYDYLSGTTNILKYNEYFQCRHISCVSRHAARRRQISSRNMHD